MRYISLISLIALTITCRQQESNNFHQTLTNLQKIEGKSAYAASPFVTAGDRVYVVGHQDGTFPDLGWHVTGEMGGVWNHPIKLLDGYRLGIGIDRQPVMCLPAATKFYNYPFASQHVYPTIDGISISSIVIIPDGLQGLIIEYQLINTLQENKEVELAFDAMVDLLPVWLSERKEITDGRDSGYWDQEKEQLVVKDSLNSWFTLVGSSLPIRGVSAEAVCEYDRKGNGVDYSVRHQVDLDPGEKKTVQYYISGSYAALADAENTLGQLKSSAQLLLDQKINRYQELNQQHQLLSSDENLNKMYEWVRYNTDWLIRDVPEEGRGLSAGIPDYPWWFGTDNGYAVEGMLAYGMFDEALATIDLVFRLSDKANGAEGQIMHETSTNGVVFNPGNLNTTPRFVSTLWNTYAWIGSDSLLQEYWPRVQKAIEWIESQDHDGNGYPDGPGMMEIPGLHTEMIDVVAYQEQAYRHAAMFAAAVGDVDKQQVFADKSDKLRKKINSDWWSGEFGSFADFRASKKQAIELTEAAIVRADTINKPWSVGELKETLDKIKGNPNLGTDAYVVHHNWVVNTPLETAAADPEKAKIALATASNYSNRFGMFVTGIDRDERQEEATQWQSFSYVGAVMTLPTAVQAIGAANFGQIDATYGYLKNLQNSFSYALPGSMYEVSPDFGMIAQAWNAYAVAVPVVQHIVGIQPMAPSKKIRFDPQLPTDISEITLKKVKVGSNLLDIYLEREADLLIASITQTDVSYGVQISRDGLVDYTASKETTTENGELILFGKNLSFTWNLK